MKILNYRGIRIVWTGHSGFRISNNIKIWIDPYQINNVVDTDIVLITHGHPYHYDKNNLKKILTHKSILIIPHGILIREYEFPCETIYVKPGDIIKIKDVCIWAVPAYNVNKFKAPGIVFHPKEALNVGYVIEYMDTKIYHSGDTDKIPEMRGLECDIALLPVSGVCVMTADEAVDAAKLINPKITIPMHYGEIIGNRHDAEKFKEKLENTGIQVIILKRE